MAIVLTDEMMDLLQGMDGVVAKAFLQGVRMAQNQIPEPSPATAITTITPTPAPGPAPAPAPQPKPHVADPQGYRNNRGAMAEILRALFTGPLSYTQLQEALRYDRLVVIRALSQGQRQGDMVKLESANGQGVWQLTPQGRQVAAVFVNNPGLKVMNRQRLAAAGKKGS